MKTSNKLAIGFAVACGAFAYWAIATKGDQAWLQEIHRDVGMGVQCEKTGAVDGHTWMACRYAPGEDQGSVWLLHNDDQGEIWLARNGPAIRVVERWQALPDGERSSPLRIRRSEPGEDLPGAVPWERLN
ncbi:hypothetical protein K4A83_11260 [Spirulina subsalsa FACHB-351]|uniref:Uncharacterized protein n=1 Tax=Spirulina subsalsa FACHB-351 TaxID=234711 RepID=A0ABT3L5P8_9CYAN|nr:hypothetical protein [Spirulina subsalsa]MCW6036836.1 hypothetical protein [Spirulina subsalsa FACHB-351]